MADAGLNMDTGLLLGTTAAIFHVLGYIAYVWGMMKGRIKPNFISWALWVLGSSVVVLIYLEETHDVAKLLLPVVCAICSGIIAIYALFRGEFTKPDLTDYMAALADVCVIIIWYNIRQGHWSYLALLADMLISFFPMIRSVTLRPWTESKLPWGLWTVAYGCLLGTTIINWEGYYPLLLPAFYLILHMAIFMTARDDLVPYKSRAQQV